jgi:hypothetical protein
MRQPDTTSKRLAVSCVTLFVLFLGITAYLVSALEGEIQGNNFTISQAIAFGNKPSMITLVVLAMGIFSYLTYYRGHNYLYFRLLLSLIICSFVITIVWVTTYYSKEDHYILAAFIFSSVVITIILNSYLIYNGQLIKTKNSKMILLALPVLAILGFVGLTLGKVSVIEDEVVQLFPSFENYIATIFGMSVFTLGFM